MSATSDAHAVIDALHARLQTRLTQHAGCETCWHHLGDGPPLVLLHGGHGSWLHWVRNVEALAATHQVWVPDMPGFGESDDLPCSPHDPQRLVRLAETLAAGIDELCGAQQAIDLAGFSFGGLVSAEVARQRGGVRRLALIGPAGHRTPRRPIEPLRDWRVPDPAVRRAALQQNLLTFMLGHPARAQREDPLAYAVHAWSCEHTRFRSKSLSVAGDLLAHLVSYPNPLLVLWGEHDVTATPREAGLRLAAGLQHSSPCVSEVVPDAGHWLQYEAADEVNQRLGKWFASD
jgi:pimeloyl-ACP methyl ester carboxylesterase